MADKVIIYTDGGSDPNPGIGGWAAVLQFGEHEKVLTGNDPQTTNSRMELQAAIGALQALKRPYIIEFHTDSEYLRKGITKWIEGWAKNNWKKSKWVDGKKKITNEPIANADLWQQLWPLTRQHEIEWHWVRGHAGNPLNERVDQLARQARLEITPEEEELAADVPRLNVRASCKGNPGPGGWGVVLERGAETEQASGSMLETTNNRMEITAVIEGLRLLPPGSTVQLFTTSDYLFQGATRWIHGWRKNRWQKKDGQPVANADLWQMLDQLMEQYKIRWLNAKGQDSPALTEASLIAARAREVA